MTHSYAVGSSHLLLLRLLVRSLYKGDMTFEHGLVFAKKGELVPHFFRRNNNDPQA